MSDPVFLMAKIEVKDHQEYVEKYGMPVFEQLIQAGAEVLAATPDAAVLEGSWSGNWTVLAKFANAEAAEGWYHSEEYAPLKKARIEDLSNSGTVILLPGLTVNP